jgi:hypothetical protein
MNLEWWFIHMRHLESGDRYRKGCEVCEMGSSAAHVDQGLAEDCSFYDKAQKSGKKSVSF